MLSYAFGETVTLLREELSDEPDSDGNDVMVPIEVEVPDSVYAPGGSSEVVQGRDTVISNPTVYLGLVDVDGEPVTPKATDQLRRANGDLYDVDGEPQVYPPNPFSGDVERPVLRLEKVAG